VDAEGLSPNDKLRKVFKDILSEMYPEEPSGIHGLTVSLLIQEINLAEMEKAAERVTLRRAI